MTLSIINNQGILGDINGDLSVNVSDIIILVQRIISGSDYSSNADINGDGSINVSDIVELVQIILS